MTWFDKLCDLTVKVNIFSSCCIKINDDIEMDLKIILFIT